MKTIYAKWSGKALFAAGAVVLLFSLYKMGAYWLDGYENGKTYSEIKEVYYEQPATAPLSVRTESALTIESAEPRLEPAVMDSRTFNPRFTELVKRNKDIVGWVKIGDTRIDYPVTQAEDNEYYLGHDVNGNENAAGSIFMDYRNEVGGSGRHYILYGHDMKNKTMFADLLGYESRWNFENKPTIEFDTIYGDGTWIIFSAYTTDSSFDYIRTDFSSDAEFRTFLNTVKKKSLHESGVEVTADDVVLTLSTCSSAFDDARFVVHAKLAAAGEL
ncbi:class B sortase [Cohnella lupini]|nr:class B sortase [Cohnella lupini]